MSQLLKIPSWDEIFMRQVYLIASKSKDPRTKVGAVLVREKVPIVQGYNGIPRGVGDYPVRMVKPVKDEWMEHAERNVFFFAARKGIACESTTLYTQGIPCPHCVRGIINSGVVELVVHEEWEVKTGLYENKKWKKRLKISSEMLRDSGLIVRTYRGKLGLQGLCDGKIINV